MEEYLEQIREFFGNLGGASLPSGQRILDAMDPIAWTLVALLSAAIVVGIFFTLSTRRSFLKPDEIESTPTLHWRD